MNDRHYHAYDPDCKCGNCHETRHLLKSSGENLKASVERPLEEMERLRAENVRLQKALDQAQNLIDILTEDRDEVQMIPFIGDEMSREDWADYITGEFRADAIPRTDDYEVDLGAFVVIDWMHTEAAVILAPEYAAYLRAAREKATQEGAQ